MEHIIYHSVMSHLEQNNILNPLKHGFRSGHSCTTQLLTVIEELAKSMDDCKQVDFWILPRPLTLFLTNTYSYFKVIVLWHFG